jgi:anti-sigma B factor antagonist
MGSAEAAGRLRVDDRLDNGVALVTVTGEIDVSTSALLREHLLRAITDDSRRSLVVNLAGLSFIDSTGTGVLVGVCATDASLALAAPSSHARDILDITAWPRCCRFMTPRRRPAIHRPARCP